CEVLWTSLDTDTHTLELPPALGASAADFVGRDQPRALLQAQWRDALAEMPQAAFISGEPGIGKTRLAAEIARIAHDAGAVVLDDLHWADRESLALLRHAVLGEAPRKRLIIGTFRDSDIRAGGALSDLLADLHRSSGVERIALTGLEEIDVVALLQAVAGHDL